MEHNHKYDAQGKQLCCTQAEEICNNAGVKELIQLLVHDERENKNDHVAEQNDTWKFFIPSIISLTLLLIAIAIDNYFPQTWFTGWVRIAWYITAYLPVGFPVLKEAIQSIGKGEIFSEFLLMSIATIGAFAIGEYPEAVAVMLFYAVGEVFQTLAVKRAKANIKTLLDQRPDEVTILQNNQAKTIKAETVKRAHV